MPVVSVADSGPLISFARASLFNLLHGVFDEIVIAPAVYDEIVVAGADRPGAQEVAQAAWIRQEALCDPIAPEAMPPRLHAGEREAIALARQMGLPLLVDDPSARREARRLGVSVAGSIAVLLEAKHRAIIPQVQPVLDRMIGAGFRSSQRLYDDVLRLAGEA